MKIASLLLLSFALRSAPSEDPCQGRQNCRAMTPEEQTRLLELLDRVEKVLPTPSPKRYQPNVQQTLNAQRIRALLANTASVPPVLRTCQSYPSGCFPQMVGFGLSYDRLNRPPPTPTESFFGRSPELSVEVAATAGELPSCEKKRPLRVLQDSKHVHEALYPNFLGAQYSLEVGPRYCPQTDPDSLLQTEESVDEEGNRTVKIVLDANSLLPQPLEARPSETLATDLSFFVLITGPKEDVTALSKRLDHKALQKAFLLEPASRK